MDRVCPSKNKKRTEKYDHLDDAFSNACSQTECTGLITHAPLTEEELESFKDIYDFSPSLTINEKQTKNDKSYNNDKI